MENFRPCRDDFHWEARKVSLSREVTTRDRWRVEIAPKLSFLPALSLYIQHFSAMIDVQDAT